MSTQTQSAAFSTTINAVLLQTSSFLVALSACIYFFRPDITNPKDLVQGNQLRELYSEYDFIIVGGGTAGSVVANRLTENKNWTVLVIEAGGQEPVLSAIPILSLSYQKSEIDWNFRTQPTPNFAIDQGNSLNLARGKVVGGCSVINAMIYCRGNRKDFDHWEQLGNTGWGYEDVLPYFRKSENIEIPSLKNSPYRGAGGYLQVENYRYISPITNATLKAAHEMGFEQTDINGAKQLGYTLTQATLKNGLRCSTSKCFLAPAQHRPNLHIILNSFVTKILINECTKTAEGVKFKNNGKTVTIKARKEVILSAGTVQTPHLLMLSGIGPKDHLTEKGIKPIIDSPGVGQNLKNHISMNGILFLVDTPSSTLPNGPTVMPNKAFTQQNLQDFLIQREGILYAQHLAELIIYVNTKYNNDTSWPDMQIGLDTTSSNNILGFTHKNTTPILPQYYEQTYGNILYRHGFEFNPTLMKPQSTGYIKLNNSDPFTQPIIDFKYMSDPNDVKILIEGAKIAYNISKMPALQKYNATFYTVPVAGCENKTIPSDEYWECLARHYPRAICHAVGTAKMGPASDTQAVVSPELLVYGITNLRVIDGSIMPQITRCNTYAPIIMIGEKGADLVKQQWKKGYNVKGTTTTSK